MALKQKISTEDYNKLSAVLKGEYKQQGEEYVLDLEGYEDPAELRRAKEREKLDKQKALEELREARRILKEKEDAEAADAEAREQEKLRKKGDIEALENSYKEKLSKAEEARKKEVSEIQGTLTSLLVDNVATSVASDISTAPDIILPHIKSRLRAEFSEGKAVTRVLDAKGQPTALSIDELKNEFRGNDSFASIIKASNASGGGANGGGKGAGGFKPGSGKKVDFSGNPRDVAAAMKAAGKVIERD